MSFLTDEPIDVAALIQSVRRDRDGAVLTFEGAVRDHNDGRAVDQILYEAYAPMAEKEFARLLAAVQREFPDVAMAVSHRLGLLRVGEVSIAIVCASAHRADAFDACRMLIDRIKETVPIWKKERGPDGEEWVGWQTGCSHQASGERGR